LFNEQYRAIARYFLARGHPQANAEDLVAATFEVAWRRLDAVPAGDEAVAWLFAVARNHSRNARRKTQREAAFISDLTPTVSSFDELASERREEFAETIDALGQLKPMDRDLILLVTWDELTPSQAGAALGLRPNAARSRLHRARQRLAALLKADAGGLSDRESPGCRPSRGGTT
jgi:RNA polymerase sigma-70 factor (ECF subfamily)